MKVVYDLSLVCARACVSSISNTKDLVLSQQLKDNSKKAICRLISLKKCCGVLSGVPSQEVKVLLLHLNLFIITACLSIKSISKVHLHYC